MVSAYENVALWHERDISHSSVERVMLPDATILLDYMLNRMASIVEKLTVYPENMKRNLEATHGLVFSQRVMLKLIDAGLVREAAYDLVQPLAMQAWTEQRPFRELIDSNPEITGYLSARDLDDAFDPAYHVRHVDAIFARAGLG